MKGVSKRIAEAIGTPVDAAKKIPLEANAFCQKRPEGREVKP